MVHPLYDPSNMTDEQITEAMAKLLFNRSHAASRNISTLVDSIDLIIDQLHEERERRTIASQLEGEEKSKVIEFGTIKEFVDDTKNN